MIVRVFNNNSNDKGSSGQAKARKKLKQESPKKSWQKYRQGSGKNPVSNSQSKVVNKQPDSGTDNGLG